MQNLNKTRKRLRYLRSVFPFTSRILYAIGCRYLISALQFFPLWRRRKAANTLVNRKDKSTTTPNTYIRPCDVLLNSIGTVEAITMGGWICWQLYYCCAKVKKLEEPISSSLLKSKSMQCIRFTVVPHIYRLEIEFELFSAICFRYGRTDWVSTDSWATLPICAA